MRDVSRRLQRALIPRNAPTVPGYDIAAGTSLEPDGHGSSAWDWFTLPDGTSALLTLSASPRDFPAAHGLAMVRAFLREISREGSDPGALLERANGAAARTFLPGIEAPVDCGVLVIGEARVRWTGAGSVHGGVLRRDGRLEEFVSCGPPLGLLDGFRYGASDVSLHAADVVVTLSHGGRGLFRGAADVVGEMHGKPAGVVVSKLQKALRKAHTQGTGEHSVLFLRKK